MKFESLPQGVRLAVEAGANHEIFRERACSGQVEHSDARGFLFLCGFDGQTYALRQGFEFHL